MSGNIDKNTQSPRVALVTGAGKGLGAAFAEALARDGHHVMVNNRTHPNVPSSARSVADHIQSLGFQAQAEESAVDGDGASETIVENTIRAFGRLDTLVLNAGITGPAVKIGAGQTTDLQTVMAINFFANVALVEAALPALKQSSAGRILMIASSAGLYGVRGRAAYAASKGALIAFGLTLADELRRTPIRVNILAPYAATAMTSDQSETTHPALAPDNAVAAATWLCRADCDYSGDVWMSGADYVARAAVKEGAGGPLRGRGADYFGANIESLRRIDPGEAFSGAEPAFAHFFKKSMQAAS
jgi:3-hydroxyacyl-CoA dehydrogenase/3a,7a,12a-trihydroxy-5b-cholest-24-enoyl-CoA hydratase